MLVRYVLADLIRNPRRSTATVLGVTLGVGLFCGVLFFIDGLSASMTQRAVAPLTVDMQRIVTDRAGDNLTLTQTFDVASLHVDEQAKVTLRLRHDGETPANEVTIRSLPMAGLNYVQGSVAVDGDPIPDLDGNPFASGPARAGHNLGRVEPATTRTITYRVQAGIPVELDDAAVSTTYSSRESVTPIPANRTASVDLAQLAHQIAGLPGVAAAVPLSIGEVGNDAFHAGDRTASGPSKIVGLDATQSGLDSAIDFIQGAAAPGGAVLSIEVSRALGIGIGDTVTIDLPDGSARDVQVSGVADVSQARLLFTSRRGGDLETFIYVPNTVIVTSDTFASDVFPAFERAAASTTQRLKTPPIREVDITLERDLLDADPATAARQTERTATDVMAIAAQQDYLLDNVTNTLHVAAGDSSVAKRLFVFLGVPGALLAAMLAAYAGNVLAEAQRREQATLRIRGASRRYLLRMLALRTAVITAAGATAGLVVGYLSAVFVLGRTSLDRASPTSLITSAIVGAVVGYAATGAALFVTGRRSIDREIAEDRAVLADHPPLWRRARLDLIGGIVLVIGTAWAIAAHAFDGTPGSVYYGRAVELNLALLVLPIAVWLTGSLVIARLVGQVLRRLRPTSQPELGSPNAALLRRSVSRRPWAISNAVIIVSLIAALATSLAAFTASYGHASANDARYATGSDLRITPSPTLAPGTSSAAGLDSVHLTATTPVIYGVSNVILRSDRTSDPANLAAIEPLPFAQITPVGTATSAQLRMLDEHPDGILLSKDMAAFLRTRPGDTVHVLLARATPEQTEIELTIVGLFPRLPGFPEGADAVMSIDAHTNAVPTRSPDFYLAATVDRSAETLALAVADLRKGPASGQLHIETRSTTLDRDQSSLAALNIAGLVDLDSRFALAMIAVTIAIFVFGLLLQRRREYVTLRALGLEPRHIRTLIAAEAAVVAVTGTLAGVMIGALMGYYLVAVLRPLFVLDPGYGVPPGDVAVLVGLIVAATTAVTMLGSRIVNTLEPTELLRDE